MIAFAKRRGYTCCVFDSGSTRLTPNTLAADLRAPDVERGIRHACNTTKGHPMPKAHNAKKQTKKTPQKSAKEKRQAKLAKKSK
jgi:hypothetical protein